MPSRIEQRLAALGHVLPAAAAPAANYVPWAVSRGMVWVAGQLPLKDGVPVLTGRLGTGVTVEAAQQAASVCALNILAQLKSACDGDLERVARCVKLVGFVASTPDFTEHHKVVNGASDLVVAAMADAGRHARSAVGVAALPFDATVEVEAVFELA
jgi:enamine deaminase RidA (YjgF/YER057c/UK114 family)